MTGARLTLLACAVIVVLGVGRAALCRARARRRLARTPDTRPVMARSALAGPAFAKAAPNLRSTPSSRPGHRGGLPADILAGVLASPAGVLATAVAGGGAGAWVVTGSRFAGAAAATVGAGAVVTRWRRQGAALRRRRAAQLPLALDRLANGLRSGSSLPAALTTAGTTVPPPLGPELAALARRADGGCPIVEVLDSWAGRNPEPGTRLTASALVLAATVGAPPARAADGVAATLRERLDLTAERRALASQARLSGGVLSLAPLAFAGLLGATDDAATDFLLGSRAGWACLAGGILLDLAGAWWMARLTRGTGP